VRGAIEILLSRGPLRLCDIAHTSAINVALRLFRHSATRVFRRHAERKSRDTPNGSAARSRSRLSHARESSDSDAAIKIARSCLFSSRWGFLPCRWILESRLAFSKSQSGERGFPLLALGPRSLRRRIAPNRACLSRSEWLARFEASFYPGLPGL